MKKYYLKMREYYIGKTISILTFPVKKKKKKLLELLHSSSMQMYIFCPYM